MDLVRVRIKKRFPETVSQKITETNSSFWVKQHSKSKGLLLRGVFARTYKIFHLAGGMGTRLPFYDV